MTEQTERPSPRSAGGASGTWAAFVRDRLDRAGFQAKDLVAVLGVDKSTVSLWLSGKRVPRDPTIIRKVAAAFSTDPKSALLAAGLVDPVDDLTALVIERPLSEVPDIELYTEVRRRLSTQQRLRRGAGDTSPLIPPVWASVTRATPGISLLAQTAKVAQHAGSAVGAALDENTGSIDTALADTILAAVGALQARGNTDVTATVLARWTSTQECSS